MQAEHLRQAVNDRIRAAHIVGTLYNNNRRKSCSRMGNGRYSICFYFFFFCSRPITEYSYFALFC